MANLKTLSALALGAFIGLAATAQAGEITSIAILVPEQGTDYGWNQQGVDAARAVAEKYGLKFLPAEGLGYGDVRPTLRELAEEGASLMIAHASGYNTAAPEIAAETGTMVAIVDRPDDMKAGLVADYTLSGHDGAYLAGQLAAKMSPPRARLRAAPREVVRPAARPGGRGRSCARPRAAAVAADHAREARGARAAPRASPARSAPAAPA